MWRGGIRAGAGRPGRRLKVDDCLRLDIRALKRAGVFVSNGARCQWTDPASGRVLAEIIVRPSSDAITLTYAANGEPVIDRVELERTPCALGGDSTWYKCPGCGKRVAILLLRGRLFRCRTCHDVPYRCQSEDRCKRMLRAESKLTRRLTPDGSRPKGMHGSTFTRLRERITDLQMRRFDLIDAFEERWAFALQ